MSKIEIVEWKCPYCGEVSQLREKGQEEAKNHHLENECMRNWNKKNIKWEPLPKYGDLFTIKEFIPNCGLGFIDSDGFGELATKNKTAGIWIKPSDFYEKNIKVDKKFTHIVWFNR